MKQSKTSYVLKQPASTPAKEVVKRAKADGIKLSIAQVYNIRSTAKRKDGAAFTRAMANRGAVVPVQSLRSDLESQGHCGIAPYTSDETALRASALNIGLLRARALLDEMGAQS